MSAVEAPAPDNDMVAPCDLTILREDDNRLRHCVRPAGHDSPRWPIPAQRKHSDGERDWE